MTSLKSLITTRALLSRSRAPSQGTSSVYKAACLTFVARCIHDLLLIAIGGFAGMRCVADLDSPVDRQVPTNVGTSFNDSKRRTASSYSTTPTHTIELLLLAFDTVVGFDEALALSARKLTSRPSHPSTISFALISYITLP